MTPIEALKLGRDALQDAIYTHIYNAEDGEEPEPDCGYVAALNAMDAVIAEAEPKPAPPRYPSPHWRDHLSPAMREDTAFEYYEVRPCIRIDDGDVESLPDEKLWERTRDCLKDNSRVHFFWTLYGRYDQGHGEMLAMAIGDFTTKNDATEVMNAILAVPAAARSMLDAGRVTQVQRTALNRSVESAAGLIEDMINQSSNNERL